MGHTKGSKNRPKDQAPLQLSQVSARSWRSLDAVSEIPESDSEEERSSLQEFKSSFQRSLKRVQREMPRIHDELANLEKSFDKAIDFLTLRVECLEEKDKRNADRIKT
ncbi:hypothetical protein HOLleu_30971 [Holothuria leucospilota]|uniref:Uncharacterized protein n=1 Tax=Holothuria leucospilota TaxID=206669 RepID=A0A9Q1H102_HOLLE|nr:hypothetical protein HOLleu_30971 [Holothuria leucospilota]